MPSTTEADPRRWAVLGVMCLSLLLIVIDNTIVNVALPSLQRELHASTSELQWIVDSYILVFAGLLLTAGALGDRFGRRGALAIGLVVLGVGSGVSAWVDSAGQLIAARAFMGIGGALIMPATLSIIINVFHDPKERGRAIAVWAGTAGMAVALGPVTGGWLLEHFWWGSVFLINVPIVVAALVLGRMLVPTSRDPEAPPLDPAGAGLSVVGLSALVYAIIEGPHGWTEPPVLGGFALAAVALGAFVWWERRVAHPMLDVAFFRNPRFSAGSAAITLTFFAMFGSLFLVTQYFQFVLDYSALETGVRLLPMALITMVAAPSSARLVEKVGTKAVVATGMGLAGLGLFLASLLTVGSSYGAVVVALLVLGLGMGMVMAPATESIMGSLPPAKAGVGSAVNDATRQVGGALGVAVLGSVLSSGYRSELSSELSGTPLPDRLLGVVTEQLGAALAVADRVGGEPGRLLAENARGAFVDGMGTSLLVASAIAVVGAVVTLIALPSQAPDPEPAADATEDEEPERVIMSA